MWKDADGHCLTFAIFAFIHPQVFCTGQEAVFEDAGGVHYILKVTNILVAGDALLGDAPSAFLRDTTSFVFNQKVPGLKVSVDAILGSIWMDLTVLRSSISSQDGGSRPTVADVSAGDSGPRKATVTLHTVVPLPHQQTSALSNVVYISTTDDLLAKCSYIQISLRFSPW